MIRSAKFTPEGGEEVEVEVCEFGASNVNGGPFEAHGIMTMPDDPRAATWERGSLVFEEGVYEFSGQIVFTRYDFSQGIIRKHFVSSGEIKIVR